MKSETKVLLCLACIALACAGCFLMNRLASVPVFRFQPTNAPAIAIGIPEDMRALAPTNNWVTEVPFDPNTDATLSESDLVEIKRIGLFHGWRFKRMERIVIVSHDLVQIEYPGSP